MAHAMSHKAGGAVAVLRHDERTEKDKVQARKNECIVPERTRLNYNLAPPRREKNLMQHIRQVCEENGVRLNNRKDLNVMSSWVITAPKELPEGMEKLFFSVCYDFLSARYGEKFVLSAMVHKDETTPHMHFCFIPVAYDRKNDRLTVSSKLVLSRSELQRFHKELGARVKLMFGKDMGIENGATKNGNQTIEQLKEKSKLEKEIQELEHQKTGAEIALMDVQSDCNEVTEKVHSTKKVLSELTREHELSEKDLEQIDVTPKKLTGGFKGLTPQQAQDLKFTAGTAKRKVKKYEKRVKELTDENNKLRSELDDAKREIEVLKRPPSFRDTVNRASKTADKDNQLRLFKEVLGISSSANYDECRRQLIGKGLLQPSRKKGLTR